MPILFFQVLAMLTFLKYAAFLSSLWSLHMKFAFLNILQTVIYLLLLFITQIKCQFPKVTFPSNLSKEKIFIHLIIHLLDILFFITSFTKTCNVTLICLYNCLTSVFLDITQWGQKSCLLYSPFLMKGLAYSRYSINLQWRNKLQDGISKTIVYISMKL